KPSAERRTSSPPFVDILRAMPRSRSARTQCLALLAFALTSSCSGSGTMPPGPTNMRILSFKAIPESIEVGGTVTLTWETTGTKGVDIEPRVGLATASGMGTDKPLTTTTYTLSIPGGPSNLTSQVTVTVTG